MKKQRIIRMIFVLIFFSLFIINMSTVNATEELPDNGAKISSAQIIQTKTGTGPFDENDEPGNDSSEDNNIVRSFDQVIWTIENTMVLNGNTSTSYTGGKIYFEATLPDTIELGTVIWDENAMAWIDNLEYKNDKRTITGYYQLGKEVITVPGKQTLTFAVNVLGAKNSCEFQPEIKLWLNGNEQSNIITIIPDKVIVSAKPIFNLKLLKNGTNAVVKMDENGKEIEGKVNGYNIVAQIYNTSTKKGLKGTEFPKGEITFDVEVNFERYDVNGNNGENITDLSGIRLYNYSTNGDTYAYAINRTSKYPFINGATPPYGNRYTSKNLNTTLLERYIYKSGNYTMEQEGNIIHVTLKNYDFDGTFPIKCYNGANNSILYGENIGCFSLGSFQTFVESNSETTKANSNFYLDVKLTNMNIRSISDTVVTKQAVTNDDESKTQFVMYQSGGYWNDYYFYNYPSATTQLHSAWNRGDGVIYKGSKVYGNIHMFQNSNNTLDNHTIRSINALYKFDTNGFEIDKCQNGSKFVSTHTSKVKFNMYYAAKKDGTAWSSIDEQNKADYQDLKYYDTLEELYADGNQVCVATLFETSECEWMAKDTTAVAIRVPLKVKDEANIGETYQECGKVQMYNVALDRTKESYAIENGKYTTTPVYTRFATNYRKTEYDENGVQVSGTHNSVYYGNTLLVVGAQTLIKNEIVTTNDDGSKKDSYDMGRNEYTVKYKLTPSITGTATNLDTTTATLKVTDVLPEGLTYMSGSCNFEEPEVEKRADGSTLLTWYIYDCTINKAVAPITFEAHIDEESANGNQYTTLATVFAGDIDKRKEEFRQSSNTIKIVNLASHRLYKIDATPVIEKNGDIHYILSYKNNTDETIPDFQLLDILPYNGDSRGTDYTGTYILDRIVVAQEGASGTEVTNDDLEILYTNDSNVRESTTCKDENLGAGWTKITSETVKQAATAIAIKEEVGAQGKVTVDIYLKTNGNKGLDKYVNNATAQVYKETEQMMTSNVATQVVERKIEGIAWEDKNANGIKDVDEEIFKNVEITLTNEVGEQVTDVNGNKVPSVRTDDNGYYVFENLPKGNYYVRVAVPNNKYELTEKEVGSNNEINSKFDVEAKETEKITKLNSTDLPELTVSYVNAGLVKKPTKVIVNYKEVGTENILHEEVTIDGRIDDTYFTEDKINEINEEYENKYKYVSVDGNTTGTMTEDTIYVTYWYDKKDTNVKVLHVKEGTDVSSPESVTDVLYPTEEQKGKVDSNYTTQNRLEEINNASKVQYELVTDEVENKNGKMQVSTIYVVYEYRTIPAKVKVNHLELNTNNVLYNQETFDGLVGNDYNTQNRLTEINGNNSNKYELVMPEPENKNGVYKKGEQTVTYYYQKKMAEIEVNYLEVGTEKVLSEKVSSSDRIDESYTTVNKLDEINEENANIYEFVRVEGNTEGVYTLDKQVITYYYQKKTAEIEVNYLEVGTGKVLSEKVSSSDRIDEAYTTVNKLDEINEKNANKYEFVRVEGNAEGVYTLDKQVIAYYYQKKMAEIEVNYLEVGTEKVLSEKVSSSDRIDEAYTTVNKLDEINEKNANKYEFVRVEGNTEGVYTLDKQVITYYYQKKVTNVKVIHVEEGTDVTNPESVTKVLYPTEEIAGRVDDTYETVSRLSEINAKNKIEYELVSVTDNASGNMKLDTIYVIYVYKKVPAKIVIKHVDIDSNEDLIDPATRTNYVGEDYKTEDKLKDINMTYEDKYELVGKPENKDGIYKKEEQEIIYYYQKKAANVIVRYVDIDTEKELIEGEKIQGKVDDEYTTVDKIEEINENNTNKYVLVNTTENVEGKMTLEEIEVVYYYKKVEAQVVVKYVDEKTGEEIAKKEYLGGYVGDKYETSEKEIDGYELVLNKIPENKNGVYEEEEIEVIYYYSKIPEPVNTGDIAVASVFALGIVSLVGIVFLLKRRNKNIV